MEARLLTSSQVCLPATTKKQQSSFHVTKFVGSCVVQRTSVASCTLQGGYSGLGGAKCLLCKCTRSCHCTLPLRCSAFACEYLLLVGMPGCVGVTEIIDAAKISVPCKHSGMPITSSSQVHKQIHSKGFTAEFNWSWENHHLHCPVKRLWFTWLQDQVLVLRCFQLVLLIPADSPKTASAHFFVIVKALEYDFRGLACRCVC